MQRFIYLFFRNSESHILDFLTILRKKETELQDIG